MLKLHSYFRSSAAYRCRIALNLKRASPTRWPTCISSRTAGQHTPPRRPIVRSTRSACDRRRWRRTGTRITQSLAIIEYLDETHPEPKLLTGDALQRARIRAFALAIACDIHPINNLRVLRYLGAALKQEQAAIDAWYRRWVETGLAACEALLPGARASSASATSRRSPTAAWCRKFTTRAASSPTLRGATHRGDR